MSLIEKFILFSYPCVSEVQLYIEEAYTDFTEVRVIFIENHYNEKGLKIMSIVIESNYDLFYLMVFKRTCSG